MRLQPLSDDPDGPAPLDTNGFRGVIVYWRATAPVTASRTKRRRAVAIRPTWTAQAIRYEILGLPGPPMTPEAVAQAARAAYAFAASYHPIPSSADVYYELRA